MEGPRTVTEPRAKCDTLVSLRDYVDTRLAAQQQAVDAARQLMEARMQRQEAETERRLDVLNHLRSDVLSKTEFISAHAALTSEFHGEAAGLRAEVAMLKEWKAEQGGKASMTSVYLAYVLGVVGLIISAVALVHEMVG